MGLFLFGCRPRKISQIPIRLRRSLGRACATQMTLPAKGFASVFEPSRSERRREGLLESRSSIRRLWRSLCRHIHLLSNSAGGVRVHLKIVVVTVFPAGWDEKRRPEILRPWALRSIASQGVMPPGVPDVDDS